MSDENRKFAERSDQGHNAILNFLDEQSDQIAEGHKEMATKEDMNEIKSLLSVIANILKKGVYISPAEEPEPGEYLEQADD
ncbi:hypothetical protein SynA1560_02197 [Synechococcus sp. A15-60]|nr:hypothetical protein SynA1560_02197 [Synechococcus sp. A15-60]